MVGVGDDHGSEEKEADTQILNLSRPSCGGQHLGQPNEDTAGKRTW